MRNLKRNLYTGLSLIILLGIAYWAYNKWIRSEFAAWEYIPNSAVLVLESNSLQQIKEKLLPTQVQLHDLPILDDASSMLDVLRSVIGDSLLSVQFLKDKKIIYSLHPEAKDKLNFVVYIPLMPSTEGFIIEKITNPNVASKVRPYNHNFEGKKVTELYTGVSKTPICTHLVHDNYLIMSKSSLLIEDVVRKANSVSTEAVKKILAGEQYDKTGKFVRVYLNKNSLEDLATRSINNEAVCFKEILSLLLANRTYQFSVTPDKQTAFAISVGKIHPFLQSLNDAKAGKILSGNMIPNNSALVVHLAIKNPVSWGESFRSYAKADEQLSNMIEEKSDTYSLNLDSAYFHLKDEAILCKVETDNADNLGNLVILPTNNANRFMDYLNFEAGKIQLVERNSSLKESFLTYQIREIKLPLPYMLFGPMFSGFEKTYYAAIGNYLIMADSPQILKNAISDISINNVWAKASKQNNILKRCRSAQLTVIVNPLRAWSSTASVFKPDWISQIGAFEDKFKQYNYLMMQCIANKQVWQTSILFGKGEVGMSDAFLNKMILQKKLPLKNPIVAKPYLFKNASAKTNELLVRTTDNHLIFLNPTGDIFSTYQLDKPVLSDIQPIDYFKNGRMQYVFSTADRLWIYDRADTTVRFYPSEPFNQVNLTNFSFFYDPVDKQKLIISDLHGGYYAYSKKDKTIKQLNYIFGINHTVVPVQSVNLGGIDYDILLQESGKLHISNAAGAEVKNSPFDLKTNFNSPVFIESSATYSSYVFHAVSRQGEVITVNLKGEELNKIQLLRPGRDSDFQLLPEQNNNDWLITCSTGQTLGILNKRGERLFEFQNLQPNGYQIAYYNFGSEIKFLTLKTGKITKIYDLTGRQIGDKGIESDFPVSLSYSESYNKLFIYAASTKNIDIWSVKVK